MDKREEKLALDQLLDAQHEALRLAREIEAVHEALDMLDPYPPKTTVKDDEDQVSTYTLAGRINRFRELLAEAAWRKGRADAEAIFARLQQRDGPEGVKS